LGAHTSPMPSILLDPHHQPSASGFGGRSVRRNSRSRYQAGGEIIEDPSEDVDEDTATQEPQDAYESGLGESKWETSPTQSGKIPGAEDENDAPAERGVLGLLYQFQKAQTAGRPGVNIV
jgi:autophagy-related protein 9